MIKPKILITTSNVNSSQLENITGDREISYTDRATALAVINAGGLPVYLPSIHTLQESDIEEYLEDSDGVLLTGADTNVNPVYYGESPLDLKGRIDDERDQIDILVVKVAQKKKLPILGLCKGAQILNVALGGTLFQDVSTQHEKSFNHEVTKTDRSNFTHKVALTQNSTLFSIFGNNSIFVNSAHQQAVKQLAETLQATAVADDEIIEAFESKTDQFILGLQFHAELRPFDPQYQMIFQTFIKKCIENRAK